MNKRLMAWPIVVSFFVFLEGCTPVRVFENQPIIRGALPLSLEQLARQNECRLKFGRDCDSKNCECQSSASANVISHRFSDEWSWNKLDKDNPPLYCLALSGGGMRAAMFSIGVLQGLSRNDDLEKTEIISSVSGGSYALSWFLAQKYYQIKNGVDFKLNQLTGVWTKEEGEEKEVGENSGSPQFKHFVENSRFMSEADYLLLAAGNTVLLPANALLNGVFGWHANTSISTNYYQRRLAGLFQKSPLGAIGENVGDMSLVDFADFWAKEKRHHQLPFFIINATALIEKSNRGHEALMANSIFEFTPQTFGSDAFGRYRWSGLEGARANAKNLRGELTLSLATAISGAAIDSSVFAKGPSQQTLASAIHQDLGYYIDNPRINDSTRALHQLLPWPFYYFSRYQRDVEGTRWYLTDGGHSENLGLFSLVRRRCQNIIVVDSEQDEAYQFDAYFRVKKALLRELGVEFKVPLIESLVKQADIPESEKNKERIEGVTKPSEEKENPHFGEKWNTFAERPVMDGFIKDLPYPGRDKKLNVTYIKLAYMPPAWQSFEWNEVKNQELLKYCQGAYSGDFSASGECDSNWRPDVSDKLERYFCCSVDKRQRSQNPLAEKMLFPQKPTTDQDFSKEQLEAYIRLGTEVVKRHCAKKDPAGTFTIASCYERSALGQRRQ